MNVYLKGALGVIVAIASLYYLYRFYEPKLPVNQSPSEFKTITAMESEGVPDFELKRLDGRSFKLSDHKGKILVVNFWASWCNPCVEEFPSMVSLANQMKDELLVVAVSTDENRADIEPFLKAFKVPEVGFEVVWDEASKVRELFAVGRIPETYIIGTDFKLVRKIVGTENWGSPDAIAFFKSLLPRGAAADGAADSAAD